MLLDSGELKTFVSGEVIEENDSQIMFSSKKIIETDKN